MDATVRDQLISRFLVASSVPRVGSHQSGTLDDARLLREAHPWLPEATLQTAAVTGQQQAVSRFLASTPNGATAVGGPHGWDALTWCCFSRWLRDDPVRHPDFVAVAQQLLEAGADANTGFHDDTHSPHPQHESVLYAAAGIARNAPLTRLLLDYGADPNDDEVPYHAAESDDLSVLEVLLLSGSLTRDSLATLLLRKADWHDLAGVERLLSYGVDPNHAGQWPHSPLLQAIRRDNPIEILDAMLAHGADPQRRYGETSAVTLAAASGRADFLARCKARGIRMPQEGIEAVMVACAFGDLADARSRLAADWVVRTAFDARSADLLARCALTGNLRAAETLLALGVPVDTECGGDGYWGIAASSTPLHVAAWRAHHDIVALLLAHGAHVHARDGAGRTPLQRAVAACVASYWTDRRSPDSVALLVAAGADRREIRVPTGYDAIDTLLG